MTNANCDIEKQAKTNHEHSLERATTEGVFGSTHTARKHFEAHCTRFAWQTESVLHERATRFRNAAHAALQSWRDDSAVLVMRSTQGPQRG